MIRLRLPAAVGTGGMSRPPSTPRRAAALRTVVTGVGAALAGLVLYTSFPPLSFGWWLAPVAVALAVAVCADARRARGAFGLGFVFGAAFLVPLLWWVGSFVGALPAVALAVAEALFFGLFGVGTRIVARLPLAPLWVALVFCVVEWLRSSIPFGGFPWGRLAFGQADSPLLPVVALIGAPGLTFVVALLGSTPGWALLWVLRHRRAAERSDVSTGAGDRAPVWRRRSARNVALGLVVAWIGVFVASAASATFQRPAAGEALTIGVVQGNVPRLGLEFNAQRQAVLDNHVRGTVTLAAGVAAGENPQPDVVFWPENASDIDPFRSVSAEAAIDQAAMSIGVPILLGAVVNNPDGTGANSTLVWQPEAGAVGRYDKRILQPFGEYQPWRTFFRMLTPLADLAGNFVPGTDIGLLDVRLSDGENLPVAVATCYEVAFDRALIEPVREGATIIYVPANTATFGPAMSEQQIAMSRVRAVEFGRTVVVPATTGRSAVIDPTGEITAETDFFTAATLVESVPLETRTTLATHVGFAGEVVLITVGVIAVAAGVVVGIRRRRGPAPEAGAEEQPAACRERGPE